MSYRRYPKSGYVPKDRRLKGVLGVELQHGTIDELRDLQACKDESYDAIIRRLMVHHQVWRNNMHDIKLLEDTIDQKNKMIVELQTRVQQDEVKPKVFNRKDHLLLNQFVIDTLDVIESGASMEDLKRYLKNRAKRSRQSEEIDMDYRYTLTGQKKKSK